MLQNSLTKVQLALLVPVRTAPGVAELLPILARSRVLLVQVPGAAGGVSAAVLCDVALVRGIAAECPQWEELAVVRATLSSGALGPRSQPAGQRIATPVVTLLQRQNKLRWKMETRCVYLLTCYQFNQWKSDLYVYIEYM